jgi:uncharacterized membrane protein
LLLTRWSHCVQNGQIYYKFSAQLANCAASVQLQAELLLIAPLFAAVYLATHWKFG